ncbi:MAG TPA: hypothetical protein VIW70_12195 [Rubrivivax sp.]
MNLRAELRWIDSSQVERRAAEASGSVTIGTGAAPAGQVTLRSDSRAAEGDVLQQVLVLNGGTAQVRLSQAVPLQWVEAVQGPRGGAVAALRQTWVEAATGVVLRPRWPGGAAPVELEVDAEVSTGAQQAVTGTQVLVPLGEWFTVARSDTQSQTVQHGTLSTREVARSRQRALQVRVSLP